MRSERRGDAEASHSTDDCGAAAVADPLGLVPCPDPAGKRHQPWAVWRSPPGQPSWARPALLGIAAVAALLYAWNITKAGYAPQYAHAVKAMSESWKAFFYGTKDPAATVTLDKLAGSFLPQALSARVLGYHAWSLALPQAIEGVISVLAMYRAVRRWAGVVPGLIAAATFTLTPIAASMFGHSMEDGALTMCLVLAADAWQRAVLEARLRSLIWAGVWVGLGFQAKMLQAWLILPALAIGYLVAAPRPLRRRLWHLGAAGAVMLAVSLSWIGLYTFTPARDLPQISGSTDNSAVAMVFGWNGLLRFGIHLPGTPDFTFSAGGSGHDWGQLLGTRFGPEIGWLYPLALLTLIFGLIWRRRAGPTDPVRGGLVMWGLWLVTYAVTFSAMSVILHNAYVASLAPPLAALSGTGIVMFWHAYRAGGGRAWVLPGAVASELAWAVYLWRGYGGFQPWARWTAAAAGAAAIAVLVAGRLPSARGVRSPTARPVSRVAAAGLAVGVVAMLAPPATWAASVLDLKYAGTSFDANAGPPTNRATPGRAVLGMPGPSAIDDDG